MKLNLLQIFDVKFNNLLDTSNHDGIEIVAIQGETLPNRPIVWWQLRTESIQCYLIVIVKVLEHTYNLANSFDVRVGVVLHLMVVC